VLLGHLLAFLQQGIEASSCKTSEASATLQACWSSGQLLQMIGLMLTAPFGVSVDKRPSQLICASFSSCSHLPERTTSVYVCRPCSART
jgi:hypothetical protein